MLMLVEQLDKAHYSPRCYVVAATDRMSGTKALTKEQAWASGGGGDKVRGPPAVAPARRSCGCVGSASAGRRAPAWRP